MDQWKQTVLATRGCSGHGNKPPTALATRMWLASPMAPPQDPLPLGGSTSTASLKQWLSTISILSEVSYGPSHAHSLLHNFSLNVSPELWPNLSFSTVVWNSVLSFSFSRGQTWTRSGNVIFLQQISLCLIRMARQTSPQYKGKSRVELQAIQP